MSERKAVVVGVDKYQPTRWTPLECCGNDALEMANLLEAGPYGFDVELLVDHEATMPRVFQAIMKARASNPELLLFYFAGHGAETDLGSYLVTFDNQDFAEGIELAKLVDALSGRGGQSGWDTVALLDCCHAGAAYVGPKNTYTRSVDYLSQDEVARQFGGLADSRVVLAACGPNDLVQESRALGHGIFTNYLLKGLEGGAADHEGNVSILSLQLYIGRPFGLMTGGRETVFRGDIHGSLVLASGMPPRLAPPMDEEMAQRIDNEARDNVDRYSRLIGKFGPDEWRKTGFEQAYRSLTPIVEWFGRKIDGSPELVDRPIFGQAYDALMSRRQQLGTIEAGLRIEEGVIQHPPLGSGGYGEVWHVKAENGMSFAYKVYHPHELRDVEKVERFRVGFQAMRMLKHDRIVKVTRFSECPLGFLMELIDGQNLRDLEPSKALTEPLELIRLLTDVADTIDHAHQNDVIHRDIKPENIIARLNPDGVWKPHLTDFDLAWYSTANKRNTKSALGVVYYAAPEQHIAYDRHATIGKRPTLDVFSFGQLIYFVLTNDDPDPVQLGSNAKKLGVVSKDWGSNEAASLLIDLYRGATEWEPVDRIQDFGQIQTRLRDIALALTHTMPNKPLTKQALLSEVRYQFSGEPTEGSAKSTVEFYSVSGNWRIKLSFFDQGSGNKLKEVLEARFIPHRFQPSLTGMPNEKMRPLLNSRVDRVLNVSDRAKRRSGRQGSFEVYIEFTAVDLNLGGAAKVRNILVRVVSALERN